MTERIKTYKEFWPFYLKEHSHPRTQLLHVLGTTAAIAFVIAAIASGHPWTIPFAFVIGYGFAWYSHFFVQRNRPATFTYPFWSFISDFRLIGYYLKHRLFK